MGDKNREDGLLASFLWPFAWLGDEDPPCASLSERDDKEESPGDRAIRKIREEYSRRINAGAR